MILIPYLKYRYTIPVFSVNMGSRLLDVVIVEKKKE